MEKLKNYLETKSDFAKEQFASSCGTTIGYINKILYSKGKLFFGPVISRRIEENSCGAINRKELRPHDWHEHWPELAKSQNNSEEAA